MDKRNQLTAPDRPELPYGTYQWASAPAPRLVPTDLSQAPAVLLVFGGRLSTTDIRLDWDGSPVST